MNPTNAILEEFESIKARFDNMGQKLQKSKTNKMVRKKLKEKTKKKPKNS